MAGGIGFVYAVSHRDLVAVPGSRDKDIIEEIEADYWQMETVSKIVEDDDLPIDLVEAVKQIVYGQQLDPELGSLYLYGVEAICWYLGSTLVLPVDFCGDEAIDEVFSAQGSALRLTNLVFSGSPITIPEPGCPPSIGSWTPEEISSGAPMINGLPLDKLEREVADGIVEVRKWLAEAKDIPNGCLVGTYY